MEHAKLLLGGVDLTEEVGQAGEEGVRAGLWVPVGQDLLSERQAEVECLYD